MSITKHWYAVYTKPRAEKKAALALTELGIEHYLPLQTSIKQWSDRKKKVEELPKQFYRRSSQNTAAIVN